MKILKRLFPLISVFLVFLACAVSTSADEDEDEVLAQLLVINFAFLEEDYEAISEPWVDEIDEDDTESEYIKLKRGSQYAIAAVCDGDCDDIDIYLFDDDGDLLDEDTTSDDVAVIEGRAPYTGKYIVVVEMADCDSEPCVFAAQAFREEW